MSNNSETTRLIQGTIDRLEYFQHLQQATYIPSKRFSTSSQHSDSETETTRLIQGTIDRLEYFQHLQQATYIPSKRFSTSSQHSDSETTSSSSSLQSQSFWYLGSINISGSKLSHINRYFNQLVFDDDFYDIARKLGSNVTLDLRSIKDLDSTDLQLQLYQFNENLSRLFKNQDKTHINILNNSAERGQFVKAYDTDLIMISVIDLIITKLTNLLVSLQSHSVIEPVVIGLVENITKKILRGKLLEPYHEMILNEVMNFVDNDVETLYFH
ncbi:hypothetical protein WICPIJ_007696 [Wickerhamomyces pijperi]|uniref:Uncharacterized protein n=1 Tax=Wickerhamomyces pijperi TaxID=599730 RepID=A0A9P8PZG0_WICPI|nr:hypothetical protein WICPIJ_007696 [Wickerhamomyces pijperi]